MSRCKISPAGQVSGLAFALSFALLLASPIHGQTSSGGQTPAPATDKTVEISPSQKWSDTKIDLHPGDLLQISATTSGGGASPCDPQGVPGLASTGKLPLNSALPAALLAKLQEKSSTLLFVGANRQLKVTEAGRLFLGSNLGGSASCSGKYSVKIHLVPGGANEVTSIKSKLATAAQIWLSGQFGTSNSQANSSTSATTDPGSGPEANVSAPGTGAVKALAVSRTPLDASFEKELESLPRRVNDEFKNPGDMVNFVLVGSEKQVQDALAAANWHVADTSTPDALAKAIMMATQKEDYLQMPMSQLYLFGRVQDFGYEQAEPYAMVASRNHFRLWKSPLAYNGQMVWVGAGTHDIGFEKDQRNGKVTHKIDPVVDRERDHIGESIQEAGKVKWMNYFTPTDPVRDVRTATGGEFHSDGRVLVIFLQ